MTRPVTSWSLMGLLVMAATAAAQGPYRPPQGAQPPAQPTFERRADPQATGAPFALTPQEQAELDRVLSAWEQQGAKVKTFDSRFTRWQYDYVFSDKALVDEGEIKYAAPDKGAFQVFGDQPEHWICDGKSIFEYNFASKQLIEHKLPPELQGKEITNSPLPFLFGSTAAALKQRYFLRLVTPPNVQGQVWLEARPRYQEDAQSFQRAEVILDAGNLLPSAIQTHEPNGKTRTVYRFEKPRVNAGDPLRGLDPLNILQRNPFKPSLPRDWTKVVEEAPTAQAARPPEGNRR